MKMRPRIAVVVSILVLAALIALAAGPLAPAAAVLTRSEPEPPPVAPRFAPEPELEQEPELEPLVVRDAFAYDPEIRAEDASGTPAQMAAAHALAALEAARPDGEYSTIQLAGLLAVRVSDPAQLLGEDYERCGEVRLAFDQTVFERNVPYRCTADLVIFNLELLDRADEPAWQNLVLKRDGTTAYTRVSLRAPGSEEILPSETTDRQVRLYNRPLAWVAGIGFLLVLVGFFRLARHSNMIRDGGDKRAPHEPLRPYSLARVQTAWWFFLVLFSFLFISLLDGSLTPIPNSILGLMGIAGGTFLGSELVDSSRRKKMRKDGDPLPYAVASDENTGFFNDIFSDDSGVAFHRFQMSVWTIALGAIFIVRVLRNLQMPEFETSILGLMGISSGTYLGMKMPETPKGAGNAAAAAAAGDSPSSSGPASQP